MHAVAWTLSDLACESQLVEPALDHGQGDRLAGVLGATPKTRSAPLPNCGLDHIAAPYSWLIPANHQSISATGIIRLTSLFSQLDRHEEDQTGRSGKTKKKASK